MKRKAMSLILAVVMVLGNCTSAMAMESEEFNVTNQETENLAGENKSAFQDAASDVESDSFLEVSSLVEDKDASVSGDDSVLFEDEMENETETETETETDTEDLTEAKAETDPDINIEPETQALSESETETGLETAESMDTAEVTMETETESLSDSGYWDGGMLPIDTSSDLVYDNFTYTVSEDKEVTITGYNGSADNLTIPEEIDGMPVTTIGFMAFAGNYSVGGSLILPNTIQMIGQYAFTYTGFSGDLTIDGNNVVIMQAAFAESKFDGKLTIGKGVYGIGLNAFQDANFSQYEMDAENLDYISEFAFANCSNMKGNINLPSSLTWIGERAFEGCSGLTGNLTIPSGVEVIHQMAFDGCSGLDGILTIEDGVKEIDRLAFRGCSSLHGDLYIPDSVTEIGESGFEGCSSLSGSLHIPTNITEINNRVFYECSGLIGPLTIPEGVTNIDAGAFYKCSGLNGIIQLPVNLEAIGWDAFSDCSGLTGDLIIPDKITSIPSGAFVNCSSLDGELHLPSQLTTIGDNAFENCRKLSGSLTLPDSVTEIGTSAFNGCAGFSGSLTLPGRITEIPNNAFDSCSGFSGSLVIPDSVTVIGSSAFRKCNGFDGGLILSQNIKEVGTCAFQGCSGLIGDLTIPDGVDEIEDYTFNGCSGFYGNLVISNAVREIGESAFNNCGSFESLTLPSSLKTIGEDAFANCIGLKGELELPSGIESLGWGAFRGCSGFQGALVIPYGVSNIGGWCFYGCSGIDAVQIPAGITDIGYSTFEGCTGITSGITIPDSVTSIGQEAFYGCTGIMIIPRSVTSIDGYGAFGTGYESTNKNITIVGYSGSSAETFAKNNNLTFIALDIENTGTGSLSDTVTWSLDSDGILTITGKGAIPDFTADDPAFADVIRNKIKSIEISDGITEIGDLAFANLENLAYVVIPVSVLNIHANAFAGSLALTDVYYGGSDEQWGQMVHPGKDEEPLKSAQYHFETTGTDRDDSVLVTELKKKCAASSTTYNTTNFGAGDTSTQATAKDVKAAADNVIDNINRYLGDLNTKAKGMSSMKASTSWQELMEQDEKNPSGAILQAGLDAPQEAKETAYVALADLLSQARDDAISSGNLNKKDYSSEKAIVNEISNGETNYTNKKKITHGKYKADYDVGFHLSKIGRSLKLGSITVTRTNGSRIDYTFFVISNKADLENAIGDFCRFEEKVAKDVVKDQIKNCLTKYFSFDGGMEKLIDEDLKNNFMEKLDEYEETSVLLGYGHVYSAVQQLRPTYQNLIELKGKLDKYSTDASTLKDIYHLAKVAKGYREKADDTDPDILKDLDNINQACDALTKVSSEFTGIKDPWYETALKKVGSRILEFYAAVIKCPVDVSVFDENGNEVAYSKNGKVYSNTQSIAVHYYNGTKYLLLDASKKWKLVYTATGDGVMNDSLSYVYDHVTACQANYYNVSLQTGQMYSMDIYPDTVLTSVSSIPLKDESGESTNADELLWADQADGVSTITCNRAPEEGGRVSDTQTAIRGDSVTVDATPYMDYQFDGWYEGDMKVSNDETYSFTVQGDKTLEARFSVHHTLKHISAKEPSCEEDGNIDCYRCSDCGTYFADADGTQELSTDDVFIPAFGHVFGSPEYTWSDDNDSCTATVTCSLDASHTITEKVGGDDISVTENDATCTEDGEIDYTAEFNDPHFTAQTLSVKTYGAFGHDWQDPEYEWSSDYGSCTAKRVCLNDESHVETEEAVVTKTMVPATTTSEGRTTYIATFSNTAFTTQVMDIPIPRIETEAPSRDETDAPGKDETDAPSKDETDASRKDNTVAPPQQNTGAVSQQRIPVPTERIIISKRPSSVKVKASAKGKVRVSWKKIKKTKKTKALLKQIKKVQIQYGASKTAGLRTKFLSGKKTSITLKLAKKKTYYIRVRYADGKGGFSKWSGWKKVKTKK